LNWSIFVQRRGKGRGRRTIAACNTDAGLCSGTIVSFNLLVTALLPGLYLQQYQGCHPSGLATSDMSPSRGQA